MARVSLTPVFCCALVACQAPLTSDGSVESGPNSSWQCSSRVELSSLWAEVRDRHDFNGDGVVTAEEYSRGEVRFANYDRNGDGTLTEADFPTDTYFNGFNHMIVRGADQDEDQRVTWEEWQAFSAMLDADGDGSAVQEEVGVVMGGWTEDWPLFLLSFDQDGDEDFDAYDLEVTFRDQDYNGDGVLEGNEMGGWLSVVQRPTSEPPAAGEMAPDFELVYADQPERQFRLHERAQEKPVALIFGSYT